MRIQMIQKQSGSYDGIHVRVYEQGEEYEVGAEYMSKDLADAFLGSGAAKEVGVSPKKSPPPGPSETKEDLPKEEKKK